MEKPVRRAEVHSKEWDRAESGHYFTSSAERDAWYRSAYAQAVDPEAWHLGDPVDAETARLIEAGLGGPQPPTYRGPDGKTRFGNHRTIEREPLRDIRRQAFAGKTMDEIAAAYAAGTALPGEDEALHLLLATTQPTRRKPSGPGLPAVAPANDNRTVKSPSISLLSLGGFSARRPSTGGSSTDGSSTDGLSTGTSLLPPQPEQPGAGPKPDSLSSSDTPARTDIRLAQADNAGTQSDANPPLLPTQDESEEVQGQGQGQSLLRQAGDAVPAYPSGLSEPSYAGERKVMGPEQEGEDGPSAQKALADLHKVQKAELWPIDGTKGSDGRPILNEWISSKRQGDGRYGMTRGGGKKRHVGYDITATEGEPVRVVKDGTVVFVQNRYHEKGRDAKHPFGNEVIIRHDDNTYTQYAHMQPAFDKDGATQLIANDGSVRVDIAQGKKVTAGEIIGYVGKTGNVPTDAQTHLHFEVRYGNHGRSLSSRTTIHPGYILP